MAAFWLAGPSCIIGTWPQPEDNKRDAFRGQSTHPVTPEVCDGLDDDGDGAIDEGCPCTAPRACVGRVVISAAGTDGGGETVCGMGIQACTRGAWTECAEPQRPYLPARSPGLASVTAPEALRRSEPSVRVEVVPRASCARIVVPRVEVVLETNQPIMRVLGIARDDGTGPDDHAADGVFTTTLTNAFGPGVPAQPLTVTATVLLDEHEYVGTTEIELEAP